MSLTPNSPTVSSGKRNVSTIAGTPTVSQYTALRFRRPTKSWPASTVCEGYVGLRKAQDLVSGTVRSKKAPALPRCTCHMPQQNFVHHRPARQYCPLKPQQHNIPSQRSNVNCDCQQPHCSGFTSITSSSTMPRSAAVSVELIRVPRKRNLRS